VSEARTPAFGSTSVLRPSAPAAAEAWRALVNAEREQVERLPNRPRPEDFYAPVAENFRADPHRTDDPLLDVLRPMVRADETWLDVGAGGGRYTLAIALIARRVFAVEPSAGMRGVMAEACREFGIDNLDLFDERWPSPTNTPIADVGFISQVGYDIPEFSAFLDQLESRSRRLCVAVLFARAPISDFAPLWPWVHGEERVLLPGLAEFTTLLFARGLLPETRLLTLPPRAYPDLGSLHAAARRPLWVLEDTPADMRLATAVEKLAVHVDDGVTLSAAPRKLGIVTWDPGA
jgi:SAM-dependent methyltransferase